MQLIVYEYIYIYIYIICINIITFQENNNKNRSKYKNYHKISNAFFRFGIISFSFGTSNTNNYKMI